MALRRDADNQGIAEKSLEKAIRIALFLSRGAKARRKILQSLLIDSKSCNQIARAVKLNWRTVNWHLQVLMKENLVRSISFGQRNFYELTPKGKEAVISFKNKDKKGGAVPSKPLNFCTNYVQLVQILLNF